MRRVSRERHVTARIRPWCTCAPVCAAVQGEVGIWRDSGGGGAPGFGECGGARLEKGHAAGLGGQVGARRDGGVEEGEEDLEGVG
jgi:hypothetical protein